MKAGPLVAFLLAATAGGVLALAQNPPAGQPPPQPPPEIMKPPNESTTPPGAPDNPKQPLTKQLKEGEGVIEPPRSIDPEIEKPVPEDFEGKMPVIPPPGEPGGNPDVQPK